MQPSRGQECPRHPFEGRLTPSSYTSLRAGEHDGKGGRFPSGGPARRTRFGAGKEIGHGLFFSACGANADRDTLGVAGLLGTGLEHTGLGLPNDSF